MAWWQWPFFCLGIAAVFPLLVAVAVIASHLVHEVRRVWSAREKRGNIAFDPSTKAPIRSIISPEARVG